MQLKKHLIKELKAYKNNSRTHSDEQVQQIVNSINAFGWTNPILLDEDKNILAGHGRLMAAEKIGMEEVPCIELVGLSEDKKKAIVIADNKLAMNAGWDFDLLKSEIGELDDLGFNLDLLGFGSSELTDILGNMSEIDLPSLGEEDEFNNRNFVLHNDQLEIVEMALQKARLNPLCDKDINENKNGNALAFICEFFCK